MSEIYRFSIKERTMRTKLSINNYYTTNVSAKSPCSTKYVIIYTKSFNKNTYPNAKELAENHIEEMKQIYC
jgi:hypothetical protein